MRPARSGKQLRRREVLCRETAELMRRMFETRGITKTELARLLGVNKGRITQLLAAKNLTLHTVADIATALGYRAHFVVEQFDDH